jgi:hypothetical protein
MDPQRTIRFLYPPLVFLGSLLLGIKLDPAVSVASLVPGGLLQDLPAMAGILAGGGLLLIVIGYVLGVLSHGVIWLLSLPGWIPYLYQAPVSDEAIGRMRETLKVATEVPPQNVLLPVAAFDHALLHPAMHDWIQRRWQVLHTSINSTTALVLAPLLGWSVIGLRVDLKWSAGSLFAVCFFVFHSVKTWGEVKGMLEFQSYGPFPPRQPGSEQKAQLGT